jgi:hypothetical protein
VKPQLSHHFSDSSGKPKDKVAPCLDVDFLTAGSSSAALPPRFVFNRCFEVLQLHVPKQVEQLSDTLKALWADTIQSSRAVTPLCEEPGFDEDAQMLRDCRAGGFEIFGDFAGRPLPRLDELENGDAVWLCQSLQHIIGLSQVGLRSP